MRDGVRLLTVEKGFVRQISFFSLSLSLSPPSLLSFLPSFLFNPHQRTCLEKGREKDRLGVKRKHRSVASLTYPNRVQNLQPRHVSWLEIKPTTFKPMGQYSNQLSRTSQGRPISLMSSLLLGNVSLFMSNQGKKLHQNRWGAWS